MPNCEHFIYTAGKVGDREGYQVIAKSSGITEKQTEELREYMYPLGITVEKFTKSKSLLVLRGIVAYSIIKNIGIGYDGRRGTLYNHTFIIKKKDFEQLNYDSRIFDQYFIEDDSIRGELESLEIDPQEFKIDLGIINSSLGKNEQKMFLYGLLKKNKISIVSREIELIQNVLMSLPPQYRLIPFSTLVIEPEKQYKYSIMQIPEEIKPKIDKNFLIVEPNSKSVVRNKMALEEITEPFIEAIRSSNEEKLEFILNDFQKASKRVTEVKRIKLKEIFEEAYFESSMEKGRVGQLKEKIIKLCTSRKFNQASPKVRVSIVKKLRKTIKKSLKQKSKTSNGIGKRDKEQFLGIIKVLLDTLHFTRDRGNKTVSPSMLNEISLEINKLEQMLNEFSIADPQEYTYNPLLVAKVLFEQAVQYGQAWCRLWFGR